MNQNYNWQKTDWARLQEFGNRPVHGLLLKGMKGIGKLDLAINYAQSLLCQHPVQRSEAANFACGTCPSCHWFEQGSHPDYRLVQPEALNTEDETGEQSKSVSGKKPSKQISVEQIRNLVDFFGMTSHQGGRRVIIIHPAEAMNSNAANALLKNLEEPPQGLLFILVSHKPQQLLPTIMSRCLSFALSTPDTATAIQWLSGKGVKDPALALASSGFAPLLAVQSDEQLCGEMHEKLLSAVRLPGLFDVFTVAEVLQKTDQVLVVQWLQQWCYDLSSMKLTGKLRYHPDEETAIKKLVESVTSMNLARLQKFLLTAKREARHTLNPKLFFESLLLVYRQLMLEQP